MTACRAPELTVKVLAETRRKIKKVFFNKYVERLVVSAPCNFNLHLAMAALKVSGLGGVVQTQAGLTCK